MTLLVGSAGRRRASSAVVLLIGQSNMAGRGVIDQTLDHGGESIYQFGAKDRSLRLATEPLDHNESQNPLIGPGLPFARAYATANPARKVVLVPAARGGTSITAWLSAGGLLDQALAQYDEAVAAIPGASRPVAALWLQGETDGDALMSGATYRTHLDTLIDRTQSHLGGAQFIIGQMVPEYLSKGTRAQVDAEHQSAAVRRAGVKFTPSPPGASLGDGNHFNAAGLRQIGAGMFSSFAGG